MTLYNVERDPASPYCREESQMTTLEAPASVLSDALLEGCRSRATGYDRENRFFFEDFEELEKVGRGSYGEVMKCVRVCGCCCELG